MMVIYLSLGMVLQIRHPIGIVRAVGTLEPVLLLVFPLLVLLLLLVSELHLASLVPGLGVTGKKMPLQVVAVEMGEVTSLTFLPFRRLLFPVAFGMHIHFAFRGGYKVAGQTFVFRLCDFVMFFIPVVSKHRVRWRSDRTLFTLKPAFWIVRFQMCSEIVVVVRFIFTLVAILNDLLVFGFDVALKTGGSEPPIITQVARILPFIVNLPSVFLQLHIVCLEIAVSARDDLVFSAVQPKVLLIAGVSAFSALDFGFIFFLLHGRFSVPSNFVHSQSFPPSAGVFTLVA